MAMKTGGDTASPLRRTASSPAHHRPSSTRTPPPPSTTPNPFTFWFYFTLTISLITLLFKSFASSQDPKSWFLSLPISLQSHYSSGRLINVQTSPNLAPIQVFTIQNTSPSSQNALIVHGLGFSSYGFRNLVDLLGKKGVSASAIDLPGSGFSDKSVTVVEGNSGGLFEIYSLIREKGLFWGFDQLVEKGYVDQEEISQREIVKPIELGSEEMGRVLGQVIDAMGLAPVDLILHDSALAMSANWVMENTKSVRSLTLIDTSASSAVSFPLWALEVPVIRDVVLRFGFVFRTVVEYCCSKSVEWLDLEAHRVLLKGRDGRKAIVGMGKKINSSFDVMEWGDLIDAKGLPVQVIWSKNWSKEWKQEGEKVVSSLPKASFSSPKNDGADELADIISQFLSKLPESVSQNEDKPFPEQFKRSFDEAKDSDDHLHGRTYSTGYADDAYGLENAWTS